MVTGDNKKKAQAKITVNCFMMVEISSLSPQMLQQMKMFDGNRKYVTNHSLLDILVRNLGLRCRLQVLLALDCIRVFYLSTLGMKEKGYKI